MFLDVPDDGMASPPRVLVAEDQPLLGWAIKFGFTVLGEDLRRELVVGAIGAVRGSGMVAR